MRDRLMTLPIRFGTAALILAFALALLASPARAQAPAKDLPAAAGLLLVLLAVLPVTRPKATPACSARAKPCPRPALQATADQDPGLRARRPAVIATPNP